MVVGRMLRVASSEGVSIYCPEDGRFSLFNSPYPAHKSYSAIDIYPGRGFGSISPSPVSGEVKKILRVLCPEKAIFKSTGYDYVILLQSSENPNAWIKILHIEPLVEVSEAIKAGDDLGVLLRSGFFDYWTDPHLHLEVRDPSDPIRARGGFRINVEGLCGGRHMDVGGLRGSLVSVREEYFLVAPEGELRYGVPVSVDGELGFIDGGIPHYGYFGIHTLGETPSSGIVRLCGVEIGAVESARSKACIARLLRPSFRVGSVPVRLSFYLYPSRPLIKVIPERGCRLPPSGSGEITISIHNH